MCGLVDVLTVLPLSPTRWITIYRWTDRENIMQELDIYIIFMWIYIIYIYRERASNLKLIFISSTWDCTTFHNFLPVFQKKYFQKLAGLWLAGEVVNHVGIYGSKAAEGLSAFQRRSCYCRVSHFISNQMQTRTTRTPAFWGYPPPPHDYPHYWIMLGPKSKQGRMTLKI